MRCARNKSRGLPMCSAKAAHQTRADHVGYRQRQALPGRDEVAVLWVVWVVVRHLRARCEPIAVVKLLRLEAPILLEGEGAGIGLAATEIEHRGATVLRSAAHHF